MGVANADGFATGDPLLAVVVAFSVSRRDPVELDAAASVRPAISRQMFEESFIARTGERDNKHGQLMLFYTHHLQRVNFPYVRFHAPLNGGVAPSSTIMVKIVSSFRSSLQPLSGAAGSLVKDRKLLRGYWWLLAWLLKMDE
jgi:hypothetical protein